MEHKMARSIHELAAEIAGVNISNPYFDAQNKALKKFREPVKDASESSTIEEKTVTSTESAENIPATQQQPMAAEKPVTRDPNVRARMVFWSASPIVVRKS